MAWHKHSHVTLLLLLAGLHNSMYAAAERSDAEDSSPSCALKCLNGGVCHRGEGDGQFDFLTKFTAGEPSRLPFLHKNHAEAHDMQHCVCPNGYTGLRCEVELELCHSEHDPQHICFNGAPCKSGRSNLGDEIWYCECTEAGIEQPRSFAGRMCEHASTVFCAWGDARQRAHSFCANGGRCMETVSPDEQHPGCECPDGWEGPHCEFKEGHSSKKQLQHQSSSENTPADASWQAKAGMFTVGVVLIGAILGAIFAVLKRSRQDRSKTESKTPVIAAEAGALEADGSTMPEKGPSGRDEFDDDVDMEAAGCGDGEFT